MSIEVVCRKYGDNKIFYSREENTGGSVIKFLSEEGLGTLREQTVIISDDQKLGYDVYWGVRYAYLDTDEENQLVHNKTISQIKKITTGKKDETHHFTIVKEQEEYKQVLRSILKIFDGNTLFILALDKTKWVEDVLKELEEKYTSKDEDSFSERGNDYAH